MQVHHLGVTTDALVETQGSRTLAVSESALRRILQAAVQVPDRHRAG